MFHREPQTRPNHRWRRGPILALLIFSGVVGGAFAVVYLGAHRMATSRLLDEATRHGLTIKDGTQSVGPLSTSLRDVRVSLDGHPHLSVEIRRLDIRHWPFLAPRASVDGILVHLSGEPAAIFEAVAKAWYSPDVKLEIQPMDIDFEHRLLGQLHLRGVELEHRGDSLKLRVALAQWGDLVWREAHLSLQRHKSAVIARLGDRTDQADQSIAEISFFSPEKDWSRWLLDCPHGPLRPWLTRLGLDPGDEFSATRAAGSISLDIPADRTQPIRGRVQMVADDWPLYGPTDAQPVLGRTLSFLSNVISSSNDEIWDLPHVVLTMPVFSLAGKGRLRLGREKSLVLDVEGERTCRQLRVFLPPSRQLDQVRQFLEKAETPVVKKKDEPRATLGARWSIEGPKGPFRPVWRFVPACGLDPWLENG